MSSTFQKYVKGTSGTFTAEYHELLRNTQWIVVKRLLRNDYQVNTVLDKNNNMIVEPNASPPLGAASHAEEFSEGDLVTVFSQFGTVSDVRFLRHRRTGKFLGTAFVKFVDYRSGILAADSMNSNFEEGESIVLSVGTSTSHSGGIIVERCEEAEVLSQGDTSQEPYAVWAHRMRTQ